MRSISVHGIIRIFITPLAIAQILYRKVFLMGLEAQLPIVYQHPIEWFKQEHIRAVGMQTREADAVIGKMSVIIGII